MINLTDVTLSRGPRQLLQKVSVTIHAGWRLGVVGRNGTGKSSLFSLLLREFTPDSGDVAVPKHLTIATVAQESEATAQTALDYVLDGDTHFRETEALVTAAEESHDGMQIAAAHERMDAIDGYATPARAGRLLHGLGFTTEEQTQSVDSFSGGWRMRLNLGRALMCRSDLLLLDEPTNHLDIDAVLWLQTWLLAYTGTLLVISHDREFLDAICTHTLHLANQTTTLYTGNYTAFERMRAERLAQQAATLDSQQRKVAHLQSFVDRFRASATKARQAQSRLKMIERIQMAAPAHVDSEFDFEFPNPLKLPTPLLRLDEIDVGYGDRVVLHKVKFSLEPGDRVGLIGPNGAGKTTLVRLLAGELSCMDGTLRRHNDLNVGYFAQHQLEQLKPELSPIAHLRLLDEKISDAAARSFLGSFNFRSERVFEPVAPFSGGEKARLALALVVYQKPNLLLLDEPTNHLDLDMRRALEVAMQMYSGAMVLVSHDRHLVASTCDNLWRVADGAVIEFDGDLDDYAKWLSSREKGNNKADSGKADAGKKLSNKDQRKAAADLRAKVTPLRSAVKKAETNMQQAQLKLKEIEGKLLAEDLYSDAKRDELAKLLQKQTELKQSLAGFEELWLSASAELEQAETELQ